jgi:hypothetical protein
MTIHAYASTDANPIANPGLGVTLAQAALPTDVQLYGDVVDTTNPGGPFSYAWTIIDAPAGSGATLSSSTSQTPLLQNVDTWGNIQLGLVVTNTASAQSSEGNPLLQPNAARITVKVTSTARGLEKPATGQRDWDAAYRAVVEAVNTGSAFVPHTIHDHTDATSTTGPRTNALTGGGYATNPVIDGTNPTTTLHKHVGAQVDAATTGARGVVTLAESAVDPAVPKVSPRDRVVFSAQTDVSYLAQGPANVILPHANGFQAHLYFTAPEALVLTGMWVGLDDGGESSVNYELKLYTGTQANFTARTLAQAQIGGTDVELVGAPATDNAPLAGLVDFVTTYGDTLTVAAGSVVALRVEGGDSNNPGQRLMWTLYGQKRW